MTNPFNPSFGRIPKIYLDRTQTVHQLEEDIQSIDSPFLTTLVYGMRGSGKTTFLSDISRDMNQHSDWIVVDLPMNTDLIPTLIESVYRQVNSDLQQLMSKISGVSLGVAGLQVSYHHQEASIINSPHQPMLVEMAELLHNKGLKLLVTIDEISFTPALREFASIYQILLRRNYHIALVMAGMPNKVSELQNDDVLTFLLRSQRIYLGPLSLITIKNSYHRAFNSDEHSINDKVLNQIVRATHGYAYAFQLLGYLLWQTGAKKITDEIFRSVLEYKEELSRNVYVKLFQELSDKDHEFLHAMAQSPSEDIKISFIQEKMGKPKNYVSMYRLRLIDDQLIEAPKYGIVRFALPFLKDFILEYSELYR